MLHNLELPMVTDIIPNRPPNLLLDGVMEASPLRSARGFWRPGPERFIKLTAGSHVLDSMDAGKSLIQLAGYTMMLSNPAKSVGFVSGLEFTSFNRFILPGQALDLFVHRLEDNGGAVRFLGMASVNGELACRTTILGFVLAKSTAEDAIASQLTFE